MKYAILLALKEGMPGYISGESLSRKMKVTRTAIWKYINELRQDGYEIDSVSRRGYRLISEPDIMNAYVLSADLNTGVIGKKILYFDEVDSTNIRAKEIATQCPDGTVVVAGRQTSGRGRLGRIWKSNEGKGLYISVILKPYIPPEEVQLITLAASVAVVSALKEASGIDAGIKWPNDIILDNKKVCGILTEMSSEMERVNYIILGIGINFSQKPEDFPAELRDKAISVMQYLSGSSKTLTACRMAELARMVFVKLDKLYDMLIKKEKQVIINLWKSMSVTLGREITVINRDAVCTGRAVDITDDGRLVVIFGDGTRKEILSGEISVRGLLGYA